MSDETSPKDAPQPARPAPPPGSVIQMASPLMTVGAQIGTHVLTALEQTGAAAVIARLVPGVQSDQVVSIPLSAEQFQAIQALLSGMPHVPHAEPEEEPQRRIGFGLGGEE